MKQLKNKKKKGNQRSIQKDFFPDKKWMVELLIKITLFGKTGEGRREKKEKIEKKRGEPF